MAKSGIHIARKLKVLSRIGTPTPPEEYSCYLVFVLHPWPLGLPDSVSDQGVVRLNNCSIVLYVFSMVEMNVHVTASYDMGMQCVDFHKYCTVALNGHAITNGNSYSGQYQTVFIRSCYHYATNCNVDTLDIICIW